MAPTPPAFRFEAIGHVCDCANTVEMNRHLKDIGSIVPKGRHAPVILDRAGWHRSGDLVFPDKCIGPEAAPPIHRN